MAKMAARPAPEAVTALAAPVKTAGEEVLEAGTPAVGEATPDEPAGLDAPGAEATGEEAAGMEEPAGLEAAGTGAMVAGADETGTVLVSEQGQLEMVKVVALETV